MFHETGHDIAEKSHVVRDLELGRDIARLVREDQIRHQAKSLAELASEVFSDVFDFRMGFQSLWSLYLPTVWVFMTGYNKARVNYEDYYVRSLYVRLYRSSVRVDSLSKAVLEAELQLLKLDLERIPGISPEMRCNDKLVVERAWAVRRAYHKARQRVGDVPMRLNQESEAVERLKRLAATLRRGEVPSDASDPRDLVLALLLHEEGEPESQAGPVSFQARMAVIVALWRLSVPIYAIREEKYYAQGLQTPLSL